MTAKNGKLNICIIGASGYTGAELVRLLDSHPGAEIVALTAARRAGQPLGAVFPHLAPLRLPDLVAVEDVDWGGIDMAFCCLPHGTTQEVISGLPGSLKIVDLSADFRFADTAVYAKWYGHAHRAPELQKDAVYGLSEIFRERIAGARLVANPGCYVTTALLPLIPLLEEGAIDPAGIVIDAKSGVTGGGRALKEGMLHAEVSEGVHAYGVGAHRHMPEIEQGLVAAADGPVSFSFTPHLMPINRGILATIYVATEPGHDADALRRILATRYGTEPFVHVLPAGQAPATRHVRGSNLCLIGVFPDRVSGRAIVFSVTDNLVKGASGQAVQNMNLMCGLDETMGLSQVPLFP